LSAKFQFSNSSTLCSFAFSTPISSSFTTNYDAIMTVGGISTSSIAESLASSSSIVVTVTTPYPSAPLLVSVTGFYKIK
jgi:hypothetical protein